MGHHSTRRITKLAFTKTRGIGWRANYRDPRSGMPRKRRFGMVDHEKAEFDVTLALTIDKIYRASTVKH